MRARAVPLLVAAVLTTAGVLVPGSAPAIAAPTLFKDRQWRPDPVHNDFYTSDSSLVRPLPSGEPHCGSGLDIGFLETCTPDPGAPATAVDLVTYVTDYARTIPGEASEGYSAPTTRQRDTLRAAAQAAQRGDVAGPTSLLAPLDYDVLRLRDTANGRDVLALRERRRADGTYPQAWGLFLLRPGATSPLVVEVPHPQTEVAIEDVGVAAFRAVDATALLVAGARRTANADGSADVAHRADSGFSAVHTALTSASTRVLQLHGFAAASHENEPDAVVSSGTTAPSNEADAVGTALARHGISACQYDGRTCGKGLGATTNVQGQQATSVGAVFVHVELADPVRKDVSRRRLAAKQCALTLG
jgi:hypothetical protein